MTRSSELFLAALGGIPRPGPQAPSEIEQRLEADLDQAEAKAWDALGRYKFQMFGYWAAIWVHQNRVGGFNRPNPWRDLVAVARGRREGARPHAA
jgi:hypothetical protein